jgi:hypothetical protein
MKTVVKPLPMHHCPVCDSPIISDDGGAQAWKIQCRCGKRFYADPAGGYTDVPPTKVDPSSP